MTRLSHPKPKIAIKKAAPFAVLAAVVGIVAVVAIRAAGTPIAFEAESGTLTSGATVTSVTGQSGTGAVKFGAVATPTPTPTPTAGFPDVTNTGLPAGTSLTRVPAQATSGPGWSWRSGEDCIHVETDGAVLSGLDISGCVEIYANNVTLKNSRITTAGDGWAVGVRGYMGATIEDTTISGGGQEITVGVKDVTGSSEVTVLRCNISDWSTGIQTGRGLIQDNYVHDPKFKTGDHTNGFTDNGGRSDGTLTVRHNTFLNSFNQADAVSLFQDFGLIQNVTVDNNLMAGGSYTLYAGAGSKGISNHVIISGNKFSTMYFPNGGSEGAPACCYDANGVGNQWLNNTWYDGPKVGQTITAP